MHFLRGPLPLLLLASLPPDRDDPHRDGHHAQGYYDHTHSRAHQDGHEIDPSLVPIVIGSQQATRCPGQRILIGREIGELQTNKQNK